MALTIPLQATGRGGIITMAGSIPIVFPDYSIQDANQLLTPVG
jgi:hypothetical protein